MPELPDVENYRQYLEKTSLKQKISSMEVKSPEMLESIPARELEGKMKDQEFSGSSRHGKTLFAKLSDGGFLVLHFGMTGYLEYIEGEDLPKHTRLDIIFSNGNHLAFVCQRKLGKVGFADNVEKYIADHDIGPDALSEHWSMDNFTSLIKGRNTDIKKVLMDQKHISGIGNVYADEILYQSGLRPARKAKELDNDEISRLHRAMLHVLKTAIDRHADPEKMPDSWILPRRKEGADCTRCSGKVKKVKVGGRSSYLCPDCQN